MTRTAACHIGVLALALGCVPRAGLAQRAAAADDFPGLTWCDGGQAVSRIRADVQDSLLRAQLEAHEAVHRRGPPGACITPSSVRNVPITSFPMMSSSRSGSRPQPPARDAVRMFKKARRIGDSLSTPPHRDAETYLVPHRIVNPFHRNP